MYIATILTLFLGLAVAAPGAAAPRAAPSKVKINDATGTLFEATFSEYIVQTGPNTRASDWRKNCKLTINMEFDSGFQFTILDTEMKGFREIPSGVKGQCNNIFSFTGSPGSATYTQLLPGPSSGLFDLKSSPGIESWSPCGGQTAILNMNTQCNINPTNLPALIDVDSVSGKLTVKFGVTWRQCPK